MGKITEALKKATDERVTRIQKKPEIHYVVKNVKDTKIEVIKVAPLGDPIDIKVKGYHLSLRKEEAAQISVEVT